MAPDDPSAGGGTNGGAGGPEQPSGRPGADQAGPGKGGADDPASPEEISRRLAGDDPALQSGSGRTRRGHSGVGADESAAIGDIGDGTTTTLAPDPVPDAAVVPELPADFDQSAMPPPESAPPDQKQVDEIAALSQAGHTNDEPTNKPALWVTAIAFGALLLVSGAWLWTRRDRFDPA
jgi:hypothetical protein